MKLLEAFEAFAEFAPEAGRAWLERLSQISLDEVAAVLDRVPDDRMSDITRRFTLALLKINRNRLLELKL